METVKSRSESPFSKKSKSQSSDISENGDGVVEPIKTKKKSQRNKQKTPLNGKENEGSTKNECVKDEESASHETEQNKIKENGVDLENGNDAIEKENGKKDTDEYIDVCGDESEKNGNGNNEIVQDVPQEESNKINETVAVDVDVDNGKMEDKGNSTMTNETENSAKNDISETENMTQPDINGEGIAKNTNGEANGTSESIQSEEYDAEASQNCVNESDSGSNYEDAHTTQREQNDFSPDTASKEENFFSNKISSFLGKWNSSPQKQDSEITSSKKLEFQSSDERVLNHPYLSKVSGRRGIKDRLNSSMSSLSSKHEEIKTPTNSGNPLDDSFRVRTNPPRLNSAEMEQNPPLRKFKGKRCLNTNDEPEDEEGEMYLSMTKRRKLTEKTQESGLLGGIWTPFKKKSAESENSLKIANPESKLSRFLSPFWFWKKTEVQKGK